MDLFPHHDGDRWSAKKAIGLDVPTGPLEQSVARRGQGGKVRHGGSRHHRPAGSLGQSEQLPDPIDRGLLQLGGYRRLRVVSGVLIPCAYQPAGCESRWKAVAGDEAEEAAAGLGHGCGRAVFMEQVNHGFGVRRAWRKWAAEGSQLFDRFSRGCDRARADAFQVVHGVAGSAFQQGCAGFVDRCAGHGSAGRIALRRVRWSGDV